MSESESPSSPTASGLAASTNPPGCDSPVPASWNGRGGCTCIICGRCKRHTGNSNQGHYWAICTVNRAVEQFHFCCPGDCELT